MKLEEALEEMRAQRDGWKAEAEGHAAGTLQHENDHLDGILFPDIARPGPFGPEALMTWAAFDAHYAAAFLPVANALRDRHPNCFRILSDCD